MSLSVAAIRVRLFSVLPLVLAGAHVRLDERVPFRAQWLEVFLIYVLAVGVAYRRIRRLIGAHLAHLLAMR